MRCLIVFLILAATALPSATSEQPIPQNSVPNPERKKGQNPVSKHLNAPTIISGTKENEDVQNKSSNSNNETKERTYPVEVRSLPFPPPDPWMRFSVILNGLAVLISLGVLIIISKQTTSQLRAYICVDSALLKFPTPNVPEAQVHYSNCGQTPAYDVQAWIHSWVEKHPLTVALPEPDAGFQMSATVMPPKGRPYVLVIAHPPIPPQSIPLLGTLQGTLYVYGEIRYRDIFNKRRFTKFRLIYGGSQGGRKLPGKEEWLLSPDAQGNEAD